MLDSLCSAENHFFCQPFEGESYLHEIEVLWWFWVAYECEHWARRSHMDRTDKHLEAAVHSV